MKGNEAVREEKFAMIGRWEESELTQKQFAEQENVSMNNFQYWLKRYRKRNERKFDNFIKLPTSEKNILPGEVFLEVIFANGTCIKFYQAVEISQLKQLAR